MRDLRLHLPQAFWDAPETTRALHERDVQTLLRLVHTSGISQQRIAAAVTLQQGRVSEIIAGRRSVSAFEVVERLAAGLCMPDPARAALGLAPADDRPTRAYAAQADAADDIRRDVHGAGQVDVLAVRALALLGLRDSLLRPVLLARSQPARVRIVLADPDSLATRRRAQEIGEDPARMAEGTRLCLDHLRDLARRCPLQVRLTAEPPVWRLIRADDVLYASVFAPGRQGHASPVQRLTAGGDEPLFSGFERAFADAFDHARPL
jgi:predicted XRE-type DNA-binding protein